MNYVTGLDTNDKLQYANVTLLFGIEDNNTVSVDTNITQHSGIEGTDTVSIALHKVAPVLLVMAATIIGNLVLIILLTNRRSRRRKRVKVFIVNLAIADLTVAFITMTTELLEAVFKQWVLGAVLCKCLLYFQVVTLSSTTFLLTGMSIDRYQMIVRPLRSLAQRPKIKAKVVMAWFMAFVFAIPQIFIFVQVKEFNEAKNTDKYYCKSAGYSAEWQRKFYFTFLTFYILLLPAGIMLFCYTAIARAIWSRGNQRENTSTPKQFESPRMTMSRNVISASRQRVVFMTLSVIIAYIVCLTPYFTICLIRIYSQYSLDLKTALTVSQIIFLLHSALNPILYGMFTLRAAHISFLCSYLPTVRRKQHKQVSTHRWGARRLQLRREVTLYFRRRNAGETSVIIAHHAAKEESSFQLRNRENGRHVCKYRSHYQAYNHNNSNKWMSSKYVRGRCNSLQGAFSIDSDTTISSEL